MHTYMHVVYQDVCRVSFKNLPRCEVNFCYLMKCQFCLLREVSGDDGVAEGEDLNEMGMEF